MLKLRLFTLIATCGFILLLILLDTKLGVPQHYEGSKKLLNRHCGSSYNRVIKVDNDADTVIQHVKDKCISKTSGQVKGFRKYTINKGEVY